VAAHDLTGGDLDMVDPMGAIHQLMSASLAALFSLGMLLSAHLFTESRSSRQAPLIIPYHMVAPL
jgi:hypothetical protein